MPCLVAAFCSGALLIMPAQPAKGVLPSISPPEVQDPEQIYSRCCTITKGERLQDFAWMAFQVRAYWLISTL